MIDYKNLCERLAECSTYGFKTEICKEALDDIEELIAEIKKLRKLYAQAETDATNLTGELSKFYAENEQLKNQLSRKTEQLKAAVGDIPRSCEFCSHVQEDCTECEMHFDRYKRRYHPNWQWRGEGKA